MIVDFPEQLLFQGSFLALNNPEQSVYIYEPKSFTPEFIESEMLGFDFVLVPHYAMDKLDPVNEIYLMLNLQSFQEMTESQVEKYLSWGFNRLTGYIYSYNLDRHARNQQLSSTTELLENYFQLYPRPDLYDQLFKELERGTNRDERVYFGVPRDSGRIIPKSKIVGIPKRSSGKQLMRRLVPRTFRQRLRSVGNKILND
jgi:hypothetical protein